MTRKDIFKVNNFNKTPSQWEFNDILVVTKDRNKSL